MENGREIERGSGERERGKGKVWDGNAEEGRRAVEKTIEAKPYAYILIRSYRVKAPWPTYYSRCVVIRVSDVYVIARIPAHTRRACALVLLQSRVRVYMRATSTRERACPLRVKAYLYADENKVPFLFTTVSRLVLPRPRSLLLKFVPRIRIKHDRSINFAEHRFMHARSK